MEIKQSPVPSPSARDVRLDALRGALLLCMTSNHLGTPLTRITVEPLGFVSSAEGFVFLSAYLAGVVYTRHLEREGAKATRDRAWQKMGEIYLWHISLFAFGLIVATSIGNLDNPISNIFTAFFESPLQCMANGILLAYQPPLFDILPIYVVGLLATPFLLNFTRRKGWGWHLFLSFTIWFTAQCGLKPQIIGLLKDIWSISPGAFDCFAWQFIWVAGLALGNWRFQRLKAGKLWHVTPVLTIPALLLGVWLFAVRQQIINVQWIWDLYGYVLDKWTLAPLRLLNLGALAVLFIGFVPERLPQRMLTPLALLGRHSLQVFCFQILATFVGMSLIFITEAGAVLSTIIALLTMGSLYLPAWWCERRRVVNGGLRASP